MTQTITLSDETFSRLQQMAKPLIDTPEMVISRLIDAYHAGGAGDPSKSSAAGPKTFDPATPPNLTHTKVLHIAMGGQMFSPSETYWNHLLFALVKAAGEHGKTPTETKAMIAVNAVVGTKTDNGYRFIPEAGVSVQGQDANGAWQGCYSLAHGLSIPLEVTFAWYQNPKAANPGAQGRFIVNA